MTPQDLRQHFVEKVLADYNEYRREITTDITGPNSDRRNSINAAGSAYHFYERMPINGSNQKNYSKWKFFNSKCNDFALLGDIYNACKHYPFSKKKIERL